ncbi:MAG: DEAD/DEAH box helicase family protein [Verrucomicrobia bacterium]|nr:DEAD/DEAH box helicase family protein [Verrucomicrobiota bacterium]
MTLQTRTQGGDLFIVDNSDSEWKVLHYLREWCDIARAFDIATGYFEIGSLLALDGQWQKLEKIRVLMGDEVSKRTKAALVQGIERLKQLLDSSLEREKETNDFLNGVPAIVKAIAEGKIEFRVYRKDKFHAKAYITHAKHAVVGASALVGSSNFTYPGLTENVELNVQLRREVELLQEWYERHWNDAEDITPEFLRVIERHVRDYTPFEVYAKALQEFFRGHEMTAGEWELAGPENGGSRMFDVLDHYQKEGYQALLKIAAQFGGAFLCDGVGLGKTFIGLMLIERLIRDRKNVALFVPKAAREDVWERDIERYLPDLSSAIYGRLSIFNHTDLLRVGKWQKDLARVTEAADAIVIDEAHHFRNTGVKGEAGDFQSRYWRLFDILEGKTVFMLTATPINNRLTDLQHMIELFSRRQPDHFRGLGIHSLTGHFRTLEKALETVVLGKELGDMPDMETNVAEAEQVLKDDELFRRLVVQRSRAYVKESQKQHGGSNAIFPKREDPKVVTYSVQKTYGKVVKMLEEAFAKDKPLFSLAVYYPLAYYIGPDMEKQEKAWKENRQKAVVSLIRTQFLKRFESSARAFEFSCETLLIKLLAWVSKHSEKGAEKKRLERWKNQNAEILDFVHKDQHELLGEAPAEQDEDVIDDEMLEGIEPLPRSDYKVDEILQETFLDLDQIVQFLRELKLFNPAHDDKLNSLIRLLHSDPVLSRQKVLIFSEYMATARYLKKQLEGAGFKDVDEVDSAVKRNRSEIIRRFAPYYNMPSQREFPGILDETRILISTDVLSEGLNLQDATRLINYDLHWNPVRLMQRVGRVDRRLNPAIEADILKTHPDQKDIRGTVAYWNFLPPKELDELLRLYAVVSHKTLRISKVFGIEGKKLLTPQDDFDALKEFNHAYDGMTSPIESMRLEYQKLLAKFPELESRLSGFPNRVFSGKAHPKPGSRAVFFCYAIPGAPAAGADLWTEESGVSRWLLFDLASQRILEEPSEIVDLIRSTPETPRHTDLTPKTLGDIRQAVEKHIKNTYLKKIQAPVGVKPVLKCWMELT